MKPIGLLMAGAFCAAVAAGGLVQAEESNNGDMMVMEKDGVAVTAEDVRRYIHSAIPEEQRGRALQRPDAVRNVLAQVYIVRQLAERARAEDLEEDPKTAWELDYAADRALSSAYLRKAVERALEGRDWETLAREKYDAAPEEYGRPEQIKASHVLIKTEGRSDEEARALAEEVRERAMAGEAFCRARRGILRGTQRLQGRGSRLLRPGQDGGALREGGLRPRRSPGISARW
ncbi:MAG: hypothetical protein U5L11_00360 [Arhodomonas sp.]|nr:hypothetical protein [Arhodomonas sp.]